MLDILPKIAHFKQAKTTHIFEKEYFSLCEIYQPAPPVWHPAPGGELKFPGFKHLCHCERSAA